MASSSSFEKANGLACVYVEPNGRRRALRRCFVSVSSSSKNRWYLMICSAVQPSGDDRKASGMFPSVYQARCVCDRLIAVRMIGRISSSADVP